MSSERRPQPKPAQEEARELFAHALLTAQGLQQRTGNRGQQERIAAILARLHDEAPTTTRRQHRLRRIARLGILAAATILVGLSVAFWPREHMTAAWADALVDRAFANSSIGQHLYDVDITFQRKNKSYRTRWRAALGQQRAFHIKLLDSQGLLPPGIEFGSDGKTLWARARSGKAFELPMHDPSMLPWADFGPELAYYELRPFLESMHGNLSLELKEVLEDASGHKRVVLGGKFRRESERRRFRHHRHRHGWTQQTVRFTVEGDILVEVDEETGQLLRLTKRQRLASKQSKRIGQPELEPTQLPGPTSFELRRLEQPEDLAEAGFNFDPPRVRTHPLLRILTWLRALRRGGAEAYRRRKARQKRAKKGQ